MKLIVVLKNYHLLLTLLKSNELDHLNILIVGINDNVEKVNKPNIKYVGYTNNDKLKLLLSNCKALICPSLYDSNPNVVCEALINDCNVIASTNCGNLHYLNEELIVDSSFWSPQTWLEKIKLAVSYKYFNKIIDKNQTLNDFIKIIDKIIFKDTMNLIYNVASNADLFFWREIL